MTVKPLFDFLKKQPSSSLMKHDPLIYKLAKSQKEIPLHTIGLIASSSPTLDSAIEAEGGPFSTVTAEGYPNRRYHSGAQIVDQLEELAIQRAKHVFSASHANVQPHSGSSANLAVIFSLLKPGQTILSMSLDAGGHLTHGARASVTRRYFNIVHYGVNDSGWLDYEQLSNEALKHRPAMIICGASSYTRSIDFERIRSIADDIDALLLADISHVSGLVAAGLYQSPVDLADVTTTSTYKQLRGPRGGLILIGRRGSERVTKAGLTISDYIDRSVFPMFQGTPNFSSISAKATTFNYLASPQFGRWASNIVRVAKAMSDEFLKLGYDLMTNGTDTHMILIDFRSHLKFSGATVEHVLEQSGVLVNKNLLPADPRLPNIASGIRLGTNELALRNPSLESVKELVEKLDSTIRSVGSSMEASTSKELRDYINDFAYKYPIPSFLDEMKSVQE